MEKTELVEMTTTEKTRFLKMREEDAEFYASLQEFVDLVESENYEELARRMNKKMHELSVKVQ
jgi:hypothetical protein